MTAIKVPILVRDRLRAAAQQASVTQAALIDEMLDRLEDELFWERMETTTPAEYQAALEADGVPLLDDYTAEDALIDQEG
jgi:hypothetical protein